MKSDLLKGLSKEQINKAKACKNAEELSKLAKQEGIELTDEQLEAISGGFCDSSDFRWRCPDCGSSDTEVWTIYSKGTPDEYVRVHCKKCGANFFES